MSGWFSLEAVYAKKGDALILHYGTKTNPQWILIDGGHTGVYKQFLCPRLDELRLENPGRLDADGCLPLELVIVSHADADHIKGIMDLTEHMLQRHDPGRSPPPVTFSSLWFNGFDDIIANTTPAGLATIASMAQAASAESSADMLIPHRLIQDEDLQAVVASTRQGRRLLDDANALAIEVNDVANGELLMRSDDHFLEITFPGGLAMKIIAPDKKRVDSLRKKWKTDLKGILEKENERAAVDAAAFADSSAFNLASIMILAERDNKTMLLTGDGRGDHLIEGLDEAGLLDNGKLHVDIFKLPHHGSDRNVEPSTFEAITASHYLVSANGEHDNPDTTTLDMLVEGRKKTRNDQFEVHFTFPDRAFALISEEAASQKAKLRKQKDALKRLDDWFRTEKPSNMRTRFREQELTSVAIDLDAESVF